MKKTQRADAAQTQTGPQYASTKPEDEAQAAERKALNDANEKPHPDVPLSVYGKN